MIVSFRSSAFNTAIPEKHFISARSFGSDLANWLLHELTRRNAVTDPMLGHADGWLVRFRFRSAMYDFVLAYRGPEWIGRLERRRGIITRLLNKPAKPVEPQAVLLIDSILAASGLVFDIQWVEQVR